ncbi:MAG: TonB-dependent receptor, partial [Marinoscillum sp.]
VETVTLQGPGRSYGIELSLKKSGRLNGWINYSYARTFIKLDSEFPEERINKGNYYPSSYDMPHTVNLVANYKITKRFSASYNLIYNTGKPVTYPVSTYGFKGFEAVNYSQRNAYRIPDYFRMDLGLSLEAGHKIKRLAQSYFTFSVYNLVGRDNPYSVFFDLIDGQVQGYKLVVFGRAIPTLGYNFEF